MTTLEITPGNLDIKATQGKTWSIVITVRDTNGALVDFTGYTVRWQIRPTAADTRTMLDLTTGAGITATNQGVITITATATQTAAIPASKYVHEIELTQPGGIIPPFLTGNLVVQAEVVR